MELRIPFSLFQQVGERVLHMFHGTRTKRKLAGALKANKKVKPDYIVLVQSYSDATNFQPSMVQPHFERGIN